MKWNAEKYLFLTAFGEFSGILFVGKCPSVRQQVNFGFRQFRANMAEQFEQPVTEQGRFASRNSERTQFPRSRSEPCFSENSHRDRFAAKAAGST